MSSRNLHMYKMAFDLFSKPQKASFLLYKNKSQLSMHSLNAAMTPVVERYFRSIFNNRHDIFLEDGRTSEHKKIKNYTALAIDACNDKNLISKLQLASTPPKKHNC